MKGQPVRRKALARADLIDDIIVWLRNTKRMWMGAGDLVRVRRIVQSMGFAENDQATKGF